MKNYNQKNSYFVKKRKFKTLCTVRKNTSGRPCTRQAGFSRIRHRLAHLESYIVPLSNHDSLDTALRPSRPTDNPISTPRSTAK